MTSNEEEIDIRREKEAIRRGYEQTQSRGRAAEAIRKYKYHIISFLLGFVIGGVIFFIITYNAISSSKCENFIPMAVVGNFESNVSICKI